MLHHERSWFCETLKLVPPESFGLDGILALEKGDIVAELPAVTKGR